MKLRIKTPPTLDKVMAYVQNHRDTSIHVGKLFFTHFEERQWQMKGKSMISIWQEELDRWLAKEKKRVAREGY